MISAKELRDMNSYFTHLNSAVVLNIMRTDVATKYHVMKSITSSLKLHTTTKLASD